MLQLSLLAWCGITPLRDSVCVYLVLIAARNAHLLSFSLYSQASLFRPGARSCSILHRSAFAPSSASLVPFHLSLSLSLSLWTEYTSVYTFCNVCVYCARRLRLLLLYTLSIFFPRLVLRFWASNSTSLSHSVSLFFALTNTEYTTGLSVSLCVYRTLPPMPPWLCLCFNDIRARMLGAAAFNHLSLATSFPSALSWRVDDFLRPLAKLESQRRKKPGWQDVFYLV